MAHTQRVAYDTMVYLAPKQLLGFVTARLVSYVHDKTLLWMLFEEKC